MASFLADNRNPTNCRTFLNGNNNIISITNTEVNIYDDFNPFCEKFTIEFDVEKSFKNLPVGLQQLVDAVQVVEVWQDEPNVALWPKFPVNPLSFGTSRKKIIEFPIVKPDDVFTICYFHKNIEICRLQPHRLDSFCEIDFSHKHNSNNHFSKYKQKTFGTNVYDVNEQEIFKQDGVGQQNTDPFQNNDFNPEDHPYCRNFTINLTKLPEGCDRVVVMECWLKQRYRKLVDSGKVEFSKVDASHMEKRMRTCASADVTAESNQATLTFDIYQPYDFFFISFQTKLNLIDSDDQEEEIIHEEISRSIIFPVNKLVDGSKKETEEDRLFNVQKPETRSLGYWDELEGMEMITKKASKKAGTKKKSAKKMKKKSAKKMKKMAPRKANKAKAGKNKAKRGRK